MSKGLAEAFSLDMVFIWPANQAFPSFFSCEVQFQSNVISLDLLGPTVYNM